MSNHSAYQETNLVFSDKIPVAQRQDVLSGGDITCGLCGIGPGEIDTATGLRARIYVGGLDRYASQDRKLLDVGIACSICIEGRIEMDHRDPPMAKTLAHIQNSGKGDQATALDWLRKKFKE